MGLTCDAPDVVERFYTKHFGFERARVIPLGDDQIVFIKSGNIYLELFQAKENAPSPSAGGTGPDYRGWRHLGFMVDDVDVKLAEMGDDANITAGPMDFDDFIQGWRTVWLTDPEGNIIELSQGFVDQG